MQRKIATGESPRNDDESETSKERIKLEKHKYYEESNFRIGCSRSSKEQTVVADRGDAIGFDSFIENATRVTGKEFTTVDSFQVWGTVKGNAMTSPMSLYNGALVERNNAVDGAAFKCHQTEYWLPSAEYNFVALAGHNGVTLANDMPATISYTANGTTDLIYTKEGETVTTNPQSVPDNVINDVNDNKCVAFNFNHLLSKVHFKFTNASKSDNYKFIIKNIKVSGQYTSGTYTIGATAPWAATGAVAANAAWSFGNATNATTEGADAADIIKGTPVTSNYARLFIPGEQELTISFTREVWTKNGTSASSTDDFSETLKVNLEENGAYTISVTLDAGTAISFTLDALGGWDNKTDISIP